MTSANAVQLDFFAQLEQEEDVEGRFVLTLGLRYNAPIRKRLDKMFAAGNAIYNAIVEEMRPVALALVNSDEWRANRKEGADIMQNSDIRDEDRHKRQSKLKSARLKMAKNAGLSDYSFQALTPKYRQQFGFIRGGNVQGALINSQVAKAIGTTVWRKFYKFLFGMLPILPEMNSGLHINHQIYLSHLESRESFSCYPYNIIHLPQVKTLNPYEK